MGITSGKPPLFGEKSWRPSRRDAICGYALRMFVALEGAARPGLIRRSAQIDGEWWVAGTGPTTIALALRSMRLFKRQRLIGGATGWGLRDPEITKRAMGR